MLAHEITICLVAGLTKLISAVPTKNVQLENGCGQTHTVGYNQNLDSHHLISGGNLRNYTIYVPNSYNDDPKKAWPLIVDYHGNNGDGNQQHANSLYDHYSDDYVVVYPNGYEGHWQGPSYAVPGVNDLQFTADLLTHLRQGYCIDDQRIYASGKSNGGGFVDTLACSSYGNEFAAFAMASAALYTDLELGKCPFKRAILESHGGKDGTIPYAPVKNGSGGPLPQVSEWVSWWAERDGCNPGASTVVQEIGYNITKYSCDGFTDVVTHYKIFDLDHCWPSSTGDNYDYKNARCDDYVLDFTPKALEFFSKWTLSNSPGAY